VNSVAPERSTLRTVLRETCSSRTISLIVLPRTKNSRRIRAIVSTPFIPQPPAPKPEQVARESHAAGGQIWTPIPRLRGSTLHADLQPTGAQAGPWHSFLHGVGSSSARSSEPTPPPLQYPPTSRHDPWTRALATAA